MSEPTKEIRKTCDWMQPIFHCREKNTKSIIEKRNREYEKPENGNRNKAQSNNVPLLPTSHNRKNLRLPTLEEGSNRIEPLPRMHRHLRR